MADEPGAYAVAQEECRKCSDLPCDLHIQAIREGIGYDGWLRPAEECRHTTSTGPAGGDIGWCLHCGKELDWTEDRDA